MLKVTLELCCNVCHGERFMLPTLEETGPPFADMLVWRALGHER
ncbi:MULTISPECIES: hypothetical protein [Halomonadaceae]|nr:MULTISPECIES: hypothetical protein [Halomonas]